MVISQTPLRIELTGGSDLPAFSRHEPGGIVNVTINKYIYVLVKFLDPFLTRPNDPNSAARYVLRHDKVEITRQLQQIQNPLVRHTLKFLKINNLDLTSIADLPSQTGLGSSGSFLVGLLNSLYALKGTYATARKLAENACYIEMKLAKVKCGAQDQYAAAYGGLRFHQFNPDGSVITQKICCSPQTQKRLEKRLLLFFTGMRRSSTNFLDNLWKTLEKSKKARKLMRRRVELSNLLARNLRNNSLSSFGEILDEEWMLKKAIALIETNPKIDALYEKAKKSGAKGGKLIGAGGGGFLLFYAPINKHEQIKKSLYPLLPTPFKFENQGSRILYSSLSS